MLRRIGVGVVQLEAVYVPMAIAELNSTNGFGYWERTFAKFRCFSLTDWKKIVLLDADIMVLDNIDELFEKPHMSAIIPIGKAVFSASISA